jgi:hypothetical protein
MLSHNTPGHIDSNIQKYIDFSARLYQRKMQRLADTLHAGQMKFNQLLKSKAVPSNQLEGVIKTQQEMQQVLKTLEKKNVIPEQTAVQKILYAATHYFKDNLKRFTTRSARPPDASNVKVETNVLKAWLESSVEMTQAPTLCQELYKYQMVKWERWFAEKNLPSFKNEVTTVKKPSVLIMNYLNRAPFLPEIKGFLDMEYTIFAFLSLEAQEAWRELLLPFRNIIDRFTFPQWINDFWKMFTTLQLVHVIQIILGSLNPKFYLQLCETGYVDARKQARTQSPDNETLVHNLAMINWFLTIPLSLVRTIASRLYLLRDIDESDSTKVFMSDDVFVIPSNSILFWISQMPVGEDMPNKHMKEKYRHILSIANPKEQELLKRLLNNVSKAATNTI